MAGSLSLPQIQLPPSQGGAELTLRPSSLDKGGQASTCPDTHRTDSVFSISFSLLLSPFELSFHVTTPKPTRYLLAL